MTQQGRLATDGFATETRGVRRSAASGSRGSGSHRKLRVDGRLKREVTVDQTEGIHSVSRQGYFFKSEVRSKRCNKSNTNDDKMMSVEFCYTGKRLSKDSFKASDCSVYFVQKGWYLYVHR